jgi:CRP/FNR family nitrogen fixation transcriptional regulator
MERPNALNDRIADNTLTHDLPAVGFRVSFRHDDEIFSVGEPKIYIYKVISGAVRTCKIFSDGRRQVVAFHLPGDIFGLGLRPQHELLAEAISDTTVLVFRRDAVLELAQGEISAANELWVLTARQLQPLQDHGQLLAKNAQERVAWFLLDMASRMPPGHVVNLPMPRSDIADYLGLTIETVSRTLTQFLIQGAIELQTARCVILRNRGLLSRLNA